LSGGADITLPVFVEELSSPPSPAEACARLLDLPYPLLLESAARGTALGRYSFLVADPAQVWTTHPSDPGDALLDAADYLAAHRAEPIPGLPPFQCGVAGFLGYEFGRRLERLPAPRSDELGLPDAWLGAYDWVVAWDHMVGGAWLVAQDGRRNSRKAGKSGKASIEDILHRLRLPAAATRHASRGPTSPPEIRSGFTRDEYLGAVDRVREYILAGDIFQANMSQRFEAPWPGDPFDFYRRLTAANPAPFAAFFRGDGYAVASASPERFLRVEPDGQVETRPIKGTRPRGASPAADRRMAEELLASEKDRAENVMIVDLLRNDLSKVCRPGSVLVPALCELMSHPTVHHLESIVTGRLEEGRSATDLLRAAFPGGSITGAPKVRAMEILAELEPVARGVYCGAIGWMSTTGAMDTSIAIRTVTLRNGRASFPAGGGIVADSDPASEYQETLDKAAGIRHAFEQAP
jgi:para-aminobenzoate synthetase component 1